MKQYLALLRAVNVGGSGLIKMGEVKQLFESLGYSSVGTYLQSGNVFFQSTKYDCGIEENRISDAFLEKYNLKVPVLLLSIDELKEVIRQNPFITAATDNTSALHVTILREVPLEARAEKLAGIDVLPGKFVIIGRIVYLYLPFGIGRSKLNNNFLESKLDTVATTRNWNTITSLMKLMDELGN